MEEIWKDIEGYEGLYQVSNLGRIKSLQRTITDKNGKVKTIKETLMKHNTDDKGYKYVFLSKNNTKKFSRVHKLIAQAFIPNPLNLPEIDHINTIQDDNRIENLRWCTHKENMNNNETLRKFREKGRRHKQTKDIPIKQLSFEGEEINIFTSAYEAGKILGYKPCHILYCCDGKRKTAYGYVWKYEGAA